MKRKISTNCISYYKKMKVIKPSIIGMLFPNVRRFIKYFSCYAINAECHFKLNAEAMLSQIAIETGWGRHILKGISDSKIYAKSNNLFNIKTGNTWAGCYIKKKVHEYYKDGKKYHVYARFRKYRTYQESINDYCLLLLNTKRYKRVIEYRHNPVLYCDMLQKCGYATDPNYAKKLKRIIKRYFKITGVTYATTIR